MYLSPFPFNNLLPKSKCEELFKCTFNQYYFIELFFAHNMTKLLTYTLIKWSSYQYPLVFYPELHVRGVNAVTYIIFSLNQVNIPRTNVKHLILNVSHVQVGCHLVLGSKMVIRQLWPSYGRQITYSVIRTGR